MKFPVVLLCGLIACGDGDKPGRLPDAPTLPRLIVEPADLTVTVINDTAVTQPYKARVVDDRGNETDVTAETTFSLRDGSYGSFTGATLSVSGQGAGPTRVEATARGVTGDAGLTVFVKKTVNDLPDQTDPGKLFSDATEDPTISPAIAYPLDKILVPPNLGQFDVHWRNSTAGAKANMFEVALANPYLDVRIYTHGATAANGGFWTVFQPEIWRPIASSRQRLTLTVSGIDSANPATKGTTAAQYVDVTNENSQGGIYYWSNTGLGTAGRVMRYDVSKPEVPPAPYFADDARPANCVGCHTLSRDGTKIAMTLNGGTGPGAIFNVADKQPLISYNPVTLSFDFATFDATATKLVTVESNQLFLRALDGTKLAGPLPPVTANWGATHPELSPDNTRLVSVEFNGGYDAQAYNGAIVIRSFDAQANTFGPPTTLVPFVAGAANWYPSFSPDGQWIAFTRTAGYSYDQPTAQTWLVKADGSQPPVQLTTANVGASLTNSWARWVPFGQTFGPDNEPIFYLTFSSKRPFGVRLPDAGRPQIWMTPVFPARAAAGEDPSGNAFRVPFQDIATNNHIAQWTKAIVAQ